MNLLEYKKNLTSQDGEDGIIEKILEVLEIPPGWCVDVGAYGMSRSNTYSLIKKGWNGVLIDMEVGIRRLKRIYRDNSLVNLICTKVDLNANRLDDILNITKISKEFGVLSIDIDGNDYHIWESLQNYIPEIVIIEFNPRCQLGYYVQPLDGSGGASLASLTLLGKKKGYELVTATTINAVFVKNNLFSKFEITDNSPKRFYIKSHAAYGRDTKNYALI